MKTLLVCSLVLLYELALADEPMRFETPNLSEEEQHSQHAPETKEMKCDFCTAIAFQLDKALRKAESKLPSSRKSKGLKESEYLETFEHVCARAWDDYGVKTVKGKNRLSGEGLPSKDFPGMMQGGGKWPGRLSQRCAHLVGEIGEDEMYDIFREQNGLFNYLCKEYTQDCAPKDEL